MTFDDGYNKCKEDVKRWLIDHSLMGIWDDMEIDLM